MHPNVFVSTGYTNESVPQGLCFCSRNLLSSNASETFRGQAAGRPRLGRRLWQGSSECGSRGVRGSSWLFVARELQQDGWRGSGPGINMQGLLFPVL